VYAYAATHHPELRLHRATKADWDAREARLLGKLPARVASATASDSRETQLKRRGGMVDGDWSFK
jgi:hypothetical protein